MKVFISGPMSGILENNQRAFTNMERTLKQLGYDVYNPSWNFYGMEWERREVLAIDIMALSKCQMMVQLAGWDRSAGAMAEYAFACASNIFVVSEEDIYARLNQKMAFDEGRDPYEMGPVNESQK